jgi:predicted nucleic-acid-binding Zn-ribbon protein
MTTIKCPNCGSTDLLSVERVTVLYPAHIVSTEAGAAIEYTGERSRVIDEESTPTGTIRCNNCDIEHELGRFQR